MRKDMLKKLEGRRTRMMKLSKSSVKFKRFLADIRLISSTTPTSVTKGIPSLLGITR